MEVGTVASTVSDSALLCTNNNALSLQHLFGHKVILQVTPGKKGFCRWLRQGR